MSRKDLQLRNAVFLAMYEGRHPHPRKGGTTGPYSVAEIAAIVGLSEQAVRDGIRSARDVRESLDNVADPGESRAFLFA